MQIRTEIERIFASMCNGELCKRCESAYEDELHKKGGAPLWEEAAQSGELLSRHLRGDSLQCFSALREKIGICKKQALTFSISHGLYASFEKHFNPQPPENPFMHYVEKALWRDDPLDRCGYRSARKDLIAAYSTLADTLDKAAEEHLDTFYHAEETHIFGILRYGFYLGFRMGVSIQNSVQPLENSVQTAKTLLLLQFDMGFEETDFL